jgi:putative FmdB family regulatory protein
VPNYNYKCRKCETVEKKFLPISTDPSKLLECPCGGEMFRSVISQGPVNGLKTFAGDWFKKTYGHELGEDGMSAAEKKADYESLLKEHKRETQ